MHRTIFTTPVVNTLLRGFSVAFLKLTGWKVEGHLPPQAAKSVFIAAPHTSNWDLPYTLMVAFALRASTPTGWASTPSSRRPSARSCAGWAA
jgi:1-acyl-sn-glycerol-3-phosphate acyltransferase